jgi:hypothetical protein
MICKLIKSLAEYQSRKADLYLRHLTWQPTTDKDVKQVNNPEKTTKNP